MTESPRLGVLLPAREYLSKSRSGAVGLCVRDFTRNSRYRAQTTILGAGPCDYVDIPYRQLVHWRRWWLRDRVAYANEAARFVRREGLALLEVENRPSILTQLRKSLPNVRLTLHLHNDPQAMEGAKSLGERRRILDQADAVYCVSEFIRRRLVQGLSTESPKALVVHNGVEFPEKPPTSKEKILAFAGRLVRDKGIVELVRAFALAAPKIPQWRLIIAGEDMIGLFGGKDRTLAPELAALGERIVYVGRLAHAEVMSLFARAEIALAPSIWQDPFPLTALEAMANSCALITTNNGGLPEAVGEAGLIVDPLDLRAFADAMVRVAENPAQRREMQESARRRIAERFDIKVATTTLDRARDQVLGRA